MKLIQSQTISVRRQQLNIKHVYLLLVFAVLLAMPSKLFSWSSDTSVNTPIALAANDQKDPVVADDGMGGVVIAWTDYRNSPDHRDVYAQRVDATGAIQWVVNGVAVCTALETQYYLQIIGDGSGGAIIAWIDQRSGSKEIYAQRIDAGGSAQWTANGVLVADALHTYNYLGIVSDGAGGIILVWQDYRSGKRDVYAQRISTGGVTEWAAGGEPIAASAIYDEGPPSITTDGSGGAIITWSDSRNGSGDTWAQRVNASGIPQWAAGGVPVAAASALQEDSSNIVSDGAGGAVVLMNIYELNPYVAHGYRAQKIDASGVTQWSAPVWLTDGGSLQGGARPVFISDGLGGAITNWDVYSSDDPFHNDRALFAQGVDTDGNLRWAAEGLFVGYKPYYSSGAPTSIVSDNAGGFISTWIRSIDTNYQLDVFAQHFNADGLPQWTPNPAVICDNTARQSWPVVLGDGSGGGVFVWQDDRNGDHSDLYAHKYSADGGSSGLQTPTNVSPIDGARADASATLTASTFVDGSGLVTHAASQWRINNVRAVAPETPERSVSGDDNYFTYQLPFSFPFFERTITSISVNANGLVELLEDGENSVEEDDYGTHSDGDHINTMDAIFAANDDLDLSNGYLRLFNAGTQIVVEWYGATYLDADTDPDYPDFTNTMLFQVVLHEDGRIIWNFSQLDFTLFDYDLYSGVYPNGGTEIRMIAGSLNDVSTPSAFEFNPATRTITPATYAWFEPQPVMYDSGETADLVSHLVPGTAGLDDGVTYYWGVRYQGDNNEWSPWSRPTGFVADTMPPVVTLREPDHLDAGVAINTVILATFSEAMDANNIDETSFTLSGPGGSVVGAVGYAAMTASFTPAGDLAPNTTYTATITPAVTDTLGKQMASPETWVFTTGADADTSPPSVVVAIPAAAASDVAIDIGTISVTFNKPINASTINQNSYMLTGPGGALAGTWHYDAPTKTARIDPEALLAFGTTYTVTVTSDIQDNAGNPLAADSWTFTTADAPSPPLVDTVPPQVVSTSPTVSPVPASLGAITVTFSESIQFIDTTSFVVSAAGNAVSGTVQYDAAAMTAWFLPTTDLAFNTQYTVRIISALIRDLAGNQMAPDYVWFFTIGEDPALAGCEPELGQEEGCENFDYFTYGTGVDVNTYGCCIAGFTAEDAARRSVTFEESLSEDLVDTNSFESQAIAQVNDADFSLRSRSKRMVSTSDRAGAWSIGASKIKVTGVPPGTVIPMSIVVSGNFTGPTGTLLLQVRDFDNYRMLGTASVLSSGTPFTVNGQTFQAITFTQLIDPYGSLNDASNVLKTTANGSDGFRLDFLYPVIPDNGIYVWFVAGVNAIDGTLNDETDFTARLEVDPPPGVTVTLASGQAFGGTVDTDGDGVSDVEENSSLDENNPAIATPPSATGTGNIAVNVSTTAGVTLSQVKVLDDDDLSLQQDGKPTGMTFPDGVVSFRINGLAPGATATVDLTFPTAFPADPKYYKVDDLGFYEFLGATFIDNNTVRLTLTDGGSGDRDGLVNGVIVDPGGVAAAITLAPLLSATPAGPGFATISWEPTNSGHVLQETLNLTPANWLDSPSSSNNPVEVPTTQSMKFYRLMKP